jgi:hypothetical protein
MTDESISADGEDTLTKPLVSGAIGERCVSCGMPMSSDQRYCVVCGERRGKPRFALPGGEAGAAPTTEVATVSAAPPRVPRASSGTTVVAGVGTLLLAMGVGVLIGRGSADSVNGKTVQAAAPTVVTVAGGAGTGTAAAAATATGKGSKKKSKGTNAGKVKKQSASKPTAAQAAKAANAASKVLGSSAANLPPATVTVGQSGHGPGYSKSGKFTGSFFGQ